MTYAKAWPYYSKKNEQIVLDLNMKNIRKILEKTAECDPYEFAKVNTIALVWQLLSSILTTNSEICLNTTF